MANRVSLGSITRIGGLIAIAFSSTENVSDFTLRLELSQQSNFIATGTNKVFVITKKNQSIQAGTNTLLYPFDVFTNFAEFEFGGYYRIHVNDVFEKAGSSPAFVEG